VSEWWVRVNINIMVDVDNYALWSFTNKGTIDRYEKAECWKNGSVFGSILARQNVRNLEKDYKTILYREIHSKRDQSEDDDDDDDDDDINVLFEPLPASMEEKIPDKLGYLNDTVARTATAKFNNRIKTTQAIRRVSSTQKKGGTLYDIADAMSPARKRQRDAVAADPTTGVPESVKQWYDEFNAHGKNGLVGLVPRSLEARYASSKKVTFKKLMKSQEGQMVAHYAKWKDKRDSQKTGVPEMAHK
jgi:hypothetical protein